VFVGATPPSTLDAGPATHLSNELKLTSELDRRALQPFRQGVDLNLIFTRYTRRDQARQHLTQSVCDPRQQHRILAALDNGLSEQKGCGQSGVGEQLNETSARVTGGARLLECGERQRFHLVQERHVRTGLDAAGGVHLVERDDTARANKPSGHLEKSNRVGLMNQDVSADGDVEARRSVVRFDIVLRELDITEAKVTDSLPGGVDTASSRSMPTTRSVGPTRSAASIVTSPGPQPMSSTRIPFSNPALINSRWVMGLSISACRMRRSISGWE
jgi:hypothetical protein